jgi:hypothetical protein
MKEILCRSVRCITHEIVLDNESRSLAAQNESLDDFGGNNTLFGVEAGVDKEG